MKKRFLSLGLAALVLAASSPPPPQADPRGMYINDFSGGFSGSEWFQITSIASEPGRYRIADIHGGGFDATIRGDSILLDGGVGEGRFTNEDSFTIMPKIGGKAFTFRSHRAAFTGPELTLSPVAGQPGDRRFAGVWSSVTRNRDPATGAITGTYTEMLKITINGTTMRITDPNNLYFQGIFVAPKRIAFRAIETGKASRPEFDTLPGSAINFAQDMVGEVTFDGPDRFSATFMLQSREPLGKQRQRLITFDATRLAPPDR